MYFSNNPSLFLSAPPGTTVSVAAAVGLTMVLGKTDFDGDPRALRTAAGLSILNKPNESRGDEAAKSLNDGCCGISLLATSSSFLSSSFVTVNVTLADNGDDSSVAPAAFGP